MKIHDYISIRHVIITIVLLFFRRDVAPIVEKIRIKTIQIWMESLANVEIQVITKIKNVY